MINQPDKILNIRERKAIIRNKKYWGTRAADNQTKITARGIKEVELQLQAYYSNTQNKVIGQFEKIYNKLLSSIEEGREPTPADLYKLDTYWEMQGQLTKELQKLGDKQAELFNKKFVEQWQNIYDALALKGERAFNTIDKNAVQQMINQVWCTDGKNWSSRIWTNTEKLRETLNENLIYCVAAGKKTTELKDLLQERFNVSYSAADSVVRTEMAHIQTQAARERYKSYGIQEVEILADEDERRCKICGKLHEKRYPIGAEVPIPAHPRCRCCIVPVVE